MIKRRHPGSTYGRWSGTEKIKCGLQHVSDVLSNDAKTDNKLRLYDSLNGLVWTVWLRMSLLMAKLKHLNFHKEVRRYKVQKEISREIENP